MDGGFIKKKIQHQPTPLALAEKIVEIASACIDTAEEELYRIFYYDCEPFGGTVKGLAGGPRIDFSVTPQHVHQTALLAHLAKKPYVAVRKGELSYRGWKLRSQIAFQLKKNPGRVLTPADFVPDFQQKGVDMRIGLDIALMAIDGLVERVALITADSDFIPAMKLARREGLQVVLICLGNASKPALLDHADIYRHPNVAGLRPLPVAAVVAAPP